VFFGLFVLVRVWFVEFRALATFFGLIGAGLAIALRDPVVNLGGWIFIVWRRPFAPGDRVEVLDRVGDVIDLRLFQFTLLEVGTKTGASQSTGRIIHVPNGVVFQNPLVNYTRGFHYVWNELGVVVTFESNWRAAKEMMLQIAEANAEALGEDAERRLRRAAQEYMISYSKLTPTVYTSVQDHGIQLTMRYLSDPRRLRGSEMLMWEAILDAFADRDDIDFAYPTTRFYHNRAEGKPGAGGLPPTLES
jgi:small-conductance mechanosensitive channel